MIKTAEQDILPFMKGYFNKIFESGYFPVEWSKAVIVPLHKKGDTSLPDNYRGISLLSIVSKVFTHIINSRLNKWTESNFVINDVQAGFRKGRSTIDHIFTLHAAIEKHFLKSNKLYVAFIDFKKAYDTVNRTVLWSVLIKTGISGRMLKMVQSIYTTVQACVLSSSGKTDYFECLQGLKQGCVISPILFSLLINELANEIIGKGKHGVSFGPSEIEMFLLLFADDLTLLSSTIVGLQNQINALHSAIARVSLTVNLDKSKVVVFRKGGFLGAKEKWFYGETRLEVVNSYKYLGLTFSTRHSFALSMQDTATRAKRSTVEILKTLRKIECNSADIFFRLFDAQVMPILLYGAEIWGYKKYDQLERIHLFACKRFLHVVDKTPNDAVYGELGQYPVWITAITRMIKYWFRLLRQPDTMYSKKAYRMLLNMHDRGTITWVSRVKTVLCGNGFEYVWMFGCGNEKSFFTELKERLQSSFCHQWCNHLDSSEVLSCYKTYKTCFEKERYVDVLWCDIYRNVFAQFRMGVSQINKHRYRFAQTTENTACPFCITKQENEIHLFFECPMYTNLRLKYLAKQINTNITHENIVYFVSSSSKEIIVNTAKFLFHAFKLRLEKLNEITTAVQEM